MKALKKALALVLAAAMVIQPISVSAATKTSSKPADGTTTNAPFPKGTAGSNSFRIPSLVTLSDGTLVAAADARWNTTYDGGGLDTIVSRSGDNGKSWKYTFANYLGDNGDTYNGKESTCFIDPAMAVTSNDTIYMLVDLYPYGVALNGDDSQTAPSTEIGFDNDGNLKLKKDGESSYNYYLKDGKIYSTSGTVITGYMVDDHFNITGTDGTNSNLFFSDSPYKVVRTGYLYLTKSTDKGATWSAPTLLNLKTSSEQVCLVGPGRGLVTSSGMIVFPVYSFHGDNAASSNTQRMSFIYSEDEGKTWKRTSEFNNNWASESAVVELVDGTLRFFYRNGTKNLCYVDYSNGAWGSAVNTGVVTNSNCQISAITYSKTVDGKQVILVSCPTGKDSNGSNSSSGTERLNGKIFAGIVGDNNTMTWTAPISVTSDNNQFMYSCLTELKDSSIAILYEDKESSWGTGDNSYYTMAFKTYEASELGLTFDETNNGSDSSNKEDAETPDTPSDDSALIEMPEEYNGVISSQTKEGDSYWQLVTNGVDGIETGKKYLIASGKSGSVYLLGYTGGSYKTTVSNNVISSASEDYQFTLTGSTNTWTIQDKNRTYLYPTATKSSSGGQGGPGGNNNRWTYNLEYKQETVNSVTISGSDSVTISRTVTSGNDRKTSYIRYESNLGWGNQSGSFKAGSSSSNLYLFKEVTVQGSTYYTVDTSKLEKLIVEVPTAQGNYTDETWEAFQTALADANEAIKSTSESYDTSESANAQQDSINNVAFELYKAWKNLEEYNTIEITINYQADGKTVKTETKKISENETKLTLESSVYGTDNKTYSVLNTELSIVSGKTVYNVSVKELEGTPISIKETETKELSVDLKDGQYVEWSTADSQYVGVAGKYDASANKYTNTGVIIGHTVTENPIVVTGTIYNSDGTIAGTQKWLVTVTAGDEDSNKDSRYIYANVTAIEHCTVYYSINGGELVKLNGTGVLVDEKVSGHYNIMFFAAPDEGYALTYMNVTGSGQQYYTLSDGNPDGTGSGAWPFKSATQSTIPDGNSSSWVTFTQNGSTKKHGFSWSLLEGNMTIEQMKLMFTNAIELGCDGATTFTKNGTDSFYTEIQFAAQKLPTIEKEIVSITRKNGKTETYFNGMKVEIGDTINYKIYIQEYAEETGPIWVGTEGDYDSESTITSPNKPTYNTGSYGTITYSKESLKDELTGGNWTPDLGTSSTSDETKTYDTSLTLTTDNFKKVVTDGKIVNTADFQYTYTSDYSEGTLDATASAVAEITVEVPSYVVDFGLPTTFDLSELVAAYGKIQGATAKYGTVSVNGSAVTYIPTETLKGVDYINLDLENGDYAVAVYPATTVYYEEGFATGNSGDWATISKDTSLAQAAEKVGEKSNIYGFDSAYNKVEASNASSAKSEKASIAKFTFTGTGVDIYTNNTTSSGVLMAWLKDAAGKTVKVIQVDTHMEDGTTAGTSGQGVNAYNVPVVSLTGLDRATYTVELRHIGQSKKAEDGTTTVVYNPVSLDGFRVHGTIDEDTTAYVSDKEDNPSFIELRDKVLAGLNVKPEESTYAKDIAKDVLAQVYATQENSEGAVIVSSYGNTSNSNYDVQDLLDNGPKNELYLRKGESVVFKVNTDRVTQIGLKALDKALTSISIKANGNTIVGAPTALSTSTDMFYKLADEKSSATNVTYTITNNSDGILSITELKICDDPNTTFCELTEEDLVPALVGLGFKTEVQYADATLNIALNDAAGNSLATTALTSNGVVGETVTFTATAIEEAVATLVPEGYELKDVSYADQEVAYGEEASVTFTAEEVEEEQPEVGTGIFGAIASAVKNFFNKIFGWL